TSPPRWSRTAARPACGRPASVLAILAPAPRPGSTTETAPGWRAARSFSRLRDLEHRRDPALEELELGVEAAGVVNDVDQQLVADQLGADGAGQQVDRAGEQQPAWPGRRAQLIVDQRRVDRHARMQRPPGDVDAADDRAIE